MKKFLALALIVAMVATFVPATLAVPATEEKTIEKQNNKLESSIQQNAVDNDGNVVSAFDDNTNKAISTENVNKKYQTLKASDLESDTKEAQSWKQIPRTGVEMMEPEDMLLGGYWFDVADGAISLVNDWFTDGSEVYAQVVHPMEEGAEDPKAYKCYQQGETVWFNYDLAKGFDTGSSMLVPLDNDVAVQCYLFAGTYEDFVGEEGTGLVMVNAWLSGKSSVSCKVTAPEDDYVYMFVFIINDKTLTQFGSWLSISYADEENEFKDITEGEEIRVNEAVTTEIAGSDTNLVVAPAGNKYVATYGAKYPIKLEGGKNYVALFDSSDEIGARVYLCDENMDIINHTYVGSDAISSGAATYKDAALIVMPPISETYYIVVCGFYMGDAGELELTVCNWEDVAAPLVTGNMEIDLDALGTEYHIEEVNGVELWGYFWYHEYSLGELIILYPGTYTVKGGNANIFCDIYDGVNMILDNTTIGSVWKGGKGFAPSTITAVGDCGIENTSLQYSLYNYEGCNSGLYIMGDSLTVISGGSSQGAMITDGTPVHILTKTLEVYAEAVQGIYPISLWTTGKNNPVLTIAEGAEFDGDNQLSTMYYDGDGYFLFGYTVSIYPELYRLHNEPTLNDASLEFVLTTEGLPEDPEDPGDPGDPEDPSEGGMLGDANCDGKVNTGDATAILRHAAGIAELDGQGLTNADVNQDGKVNTGDATKVLRIVAGLDEQP